MNGLLIIIYLAVLILVIAGFWKVFEKAGEAGWKSIIPIWNTLIVLKIAGREWWWIILMLIPVVGFVVWIIVSIDVARHFGRGTGFGVGLALLPMIFYPVLGFGSDRYAGPAVAGAAAA